ncbi:hypothetical protein RF11_06582 [Thelohanellus kitauei]|uniref:Reverse transcriptase domain-containing protein n=1 Tax=Thelohanellus kitauei TaxID=669202 RepID=A0A0C2JAC9_THEKT|nr:hypothetical protein RF11_06582 [Thelohanellus kitauei]
MVEYNNAKNCWSLLKNPTSFQNTPHPSYSLLPNEIDSHLATIWSKSVIDNKQIGIPHILPTTFNFPQIDNKNECIRFTFQEVDNAIAPLKPNKPPVSTESFPTPHASGSYCKTWLNSFYNRINFERTIPKIWLKSKIVSILKPIKDPTSTSSYRPISLQ